MAIERVYYCDWHECERHVQTASPHPPTFLTVTEGAGHQQHFCTWDCLLKQAAAKPPSEVFPMTADS